MLYKTPTGRELLGSVEQGAEAVQHPCAIQACRIMKPHEGQKGPELLLVVPVRPASSHQGFDEIRG